MCATRRGLRLGVAAAATAGALLLPAGTASAQTCVPATSVCVSGLPNPTGTVTYVANTALGLAGSAYGLAYTTTNDTVDWTREVGELCLPTARPICVNGVGATVATYDDQLCATEVAGTEPYAVVRRCPPTW